jgi:hypothetical protein
VIVVARNVTGIRQREGVSHRVPDGRTLAVSVPGSLYLVRGCANAPYEVILIVLHSKIIDAKPGSETAVVL